MAPAISYPITRPISRALSGSFGGAAKTHVLMPLFRGQSNAQGFGSSVGLAGSQINPVHWSAPDARIQIWNGSAFETYQPYVNSDPISGNACWGAEAEFAYRYLQANPTKTVYLVKYAVGSTGLAADVGAQDWNVATVSELYANSVAYANNAKAWLLARGKIADIVECWTQGEEDATDNTKAAAYSTNLTNFISSSRAAIGYSRFILARIRSEITGSHPGLAVVRAAQETVMSADQNVEMVSEDAMLSEDGIHLRTTELDNLGGLYWDVYNKWYAQGSLSAFSHIADFNNDRYAKPFVPGDLTTMKSALVTDLLTLTAASTTLRYYVARDAFAASQQTGVAVYKNNLAANAFRFNWLNGKRQLRVEGSFQNAVLQDRDLTNVAWVASSITAAKDQTGIDGAANSASSITATGANGTILQSITAGVATRIQSAFVKRITGAGTLEMTQNGGTTWAVVTVTGAWTRVKLVAASVTNPQVGFRVATSADAFAIDLVQNEINSAPSMPIASAGSAPTRGAETLVGTASTVSAWAGSAGSVIMRGQGILKTSPALLGADAVSLFAKDSAGRLTFNNNVGGPITSGGFASTWGIAGGFDATGMRAAFNSSAVTTNGTAAPAHTGLYIAQLQSGSAASFLDADLDFIAFAPSLVPDAMLTALAVAAP